MKYNPYGKLEKNASRICFDGCQLGSSEIKNEMNFQDGVNLVKEAYNNGITLFNTSFEYNNGLSEKILGEALYDVREDVIINTKIGNKIDGSTGYSVESIESQIIESLKRLKTDYIDSVLIDNPDMDILLGKTNHFKELKRLKEKGLIKSYGVSINTYQELKAAIEKTDSQVIEILFNVFFQEPSSIFMFVKHKKLAMIVKKPLDSGWLTGKYDSFSTFEDLKLQWDKKTLERRVDLIRKMKLITGDENLTKYAISFILSFGGITSVSTTIKNSDQLIEIINSDEYEIDYKLKQKLIDLYNQQIKNNPL
ncbi:MAG: aldo/keto reductase [Candidatus Izemoplasmatales bacterium]